MHTGRTARCSFAETLRHTTTKESDMPDKSPQKPAGKKPGKSPKEKREAKREKK
jgi:hypothetical protein